MTTKIEWADETWNVVTGCDRVSPGCDHCYALTMAGRLKAMGQPKYQADGDPRTSGPGFKLTVHPGALDAPLHWRTPRRVFVNSMSDLFHPDVPDEFITRVYGVMYEAHRHTFQVLTKRPQRMMNLLTWAPFVDMAAGAIESMLDDPDDAYVQEGPWPPDNVWLGTSVESDRYAFRANFLRGTPAAVRFLSLEPLLGPLPSLDLTGIDWVIVGGESGPGARPMHPDWVRDIRDRCVAASIRFFFKQWGAFSPDLDRLGIDPPGDDGRVLTMWPGGRCSWGEHGTSTDGSELLVRVSKKAAGRLLDGREWNEYPS